MNIPVIYGSVRRERKGIHGARFVARMLRGRGHEAPLIDPLEHPLPLLDLMYKEYESGGAPEAMESLARIYRAADAFVFVTGEYNHGIPPAMKNQIDHFLETWFWRPAGIACYSAGPFGGVRAAMQMRCVLGEVGLVTVPSILAMPRVGQSFAEDGTPSDAAWDRRAAKFLDEIEWYAEALAAQREKKGVPYS
jgi:NAD(P)H-dependent FMN reductase